MTLAMCGCSSSSVSKGAPPLVPQGAPVRLVVLGADQALGSGVGRSERNRSTWPQLLFREHLPVRATLVNLASADATSADVRDAQVPRALGLQPTIAIVWVDGQDAAFTTALQSLASAGATVLAVSAPDQVVATQQAAGATGARVVSVASDASQQAIADAMSAALGPIS
jgi:hypothetical protein